MTQPRLERWIFRIKVKCIKEWVALLCIACWDTLHDVSQVPWQWLSYQPIIFPYTWCYKFQNTKCQDIAKLCIQWLHCTFFFIFASEASQFLFIFMFPFSLNNFTKCHETTVYCAFGNSVWHSAWLSPGRYRHYGTSCGEIRVISLFWYTKCHVLHAVGHISSQGSTC